MFCPILGQINHEDGDCKRDKCAWWDGARCAVLAIAQELARSNQRIEDDYEREQRIADAQTRRSTW